MSKVSIIMPCFNDGEYIQESIESVLNQTYKNIELIIINDGSTDEKTINILNSISNPLIEVLNTTNIGPAGARNFGIENAKGKYILPLDADDLIDSTYIEKCINEMESNNKVGIVYCYANLFGEKSGRWDLPDYSFQSMLLDNIIFVTAMFKKEDWEEVGGYNTSLIHGMEDYDFWLSILELERDVVQIKDILFHYRIKTTSRTTNFMKDINIVKDTYRNLYLNHPKLFNRNKDDYAIILRNALIEQIYLNKKITSFSPFLNKLKNIRFVKKIVFKILLRKG